MALRGKTKRRTAIVVAAVVVTAALGTGGYFLRLNQLKSAAEAGYARGLESLKRGEYFDALHAIGSYLKWHPKDAEALYAYATARRQVEMPEGKHFNEALNFLRRASDLAPGNMEMAHDLINQYIELGLDTEAEALAKSVLTSAPDDMVAKRGLSIALIRSKQYTEGLKLTRERLTADPSDSDAQLQLLAGVFAAQGAQAAMEMADADVKASPNAPIMWLERSMVAMQLNDKRKAVDSMLQALKLMESSPGQPEKELLLNMVRHSELLAQLVNDPAVYTQVFASTHRLILGAADAGVQGFETEALRRVYYTGDLPAAAVRASRPAPQTVAAPKDAYSQSEIRELPAVRAFVLIEAGRKDEAREIVRKMGTSQKEWTAVLNRMLTEGSTDQQLLGDLETAVRMRPRVSLFQMQLGNAYERVGDRESALQAWEAASVLAAQWSEPLVRLSKANLASGRLQQAVDWARAAAERSPASPEPARVLINVWVEAVRGRANADLERLGGAIREFERRFPEDSFVPIQEARLMASQDRAGDVKRITESLLGRPTVLPTDSLIALNEACREAKLPDLAAQVLAVSDKAYGQKPEVAGLRARLLALTGDVAGGMKLIADARAAAAGKEEREWGLQQALYLERVNDPRAKEEWVKLSESRPADAPLQWIAMSAPSVRADRPLAAKLIERLKGLTGNNSLSWKIAKAMFLLEGPRRTEAGKAFPETTDAAVLLGEVTRSAPELTSARVLLADALERMDNLPGAIEQLRAIKPERLSADVQLQLVSMILSNGDVEASKSELRLLIDKGKLTPAQADQAAKLAARQGDPDLALKLLAGGGGDNDLMAARLHRQRRELDKVDALLPKLSGKDDIETIQFVADYQASTGRIAEATATLDRLKAHDEKEALVSNLVRGEWYARYGTLSQATEAYEAAIKAQPAEPTSWRRLVSVQIRQKDVEKAIDTATRAIAASPRDEVLKEMAAQVPQLRNKERIADNVYTGLIAGLLLANVDEAKVIQDALHVYTQESDAPKMRAALRSIADRNGRCLTVQLATARAYMLSSNYEDGAKVATRTMEAFPNDVTSAQLAASCLSALGRNDEARVATEKWRARETGDNVLPDTMLSAIDLQTGKQKDARARMQPYMAKALADPEKNHQVLYQYGRAMIATNQADNFMTQLRPLLPKSETARTVVMRLSPEPSLGNRALIWLREVRPNLNPKSFTEHTVLVESLGAVYRRTGQQEIRAELDSVLGLLADESRPWDDMTGNIRLGMYLTLATVQESLDAKPQAEVTYRRILKAYPDNAIALNNLAYLLVRSAGSLPEALALSEKAVALTDDPRRGDYLDTQARVQLAMKSYSAALASVNSALSLQPQNVEWLILQGEIELENKETDKARQTLQKVRNIQPNENVLSPEGKKSLEKLRDNLKN